MKSYVCGLAGLLLSGAVSAANIIPDESIRLLVVNGVNVDTVLEKADKAKVDSGYTQLVVRYSEKVGKGSTGRVYDSNPFLLMFEAGEKDVTIVAPDFVDYEQAKRHFKKKPDIKLIVDGKEIPYTYDKLPGRGGFMSYRKPEELVAKYNAENGISFGVNAELIAEAQTVSDKPVPQTKATTHTQTAVEASSAAVAISNVDQLKGWYLKASKAERKEFKKWMIDQD